jgi:hypothetical protein
VGAQLRNHCKDHNFRVIDNMHFPFFEVTWSADEEMLLLEGLEVCGVFKTTSRWRFMVLVIGKTLPTTSPRKTNTTVKDITWSITLTRPSGLI